MNAKLLFAGVGVLAFLAGTALWLGSRESPSSEINPSVEATPAALFAAAFKDSEGRDQAIGQFQGKVVVVNFWATWCAPCKEEMPGFVRLQARWKDKGVQFLGIANDDPAKVRRFGSDLAINYPLWTGGAEVSELSKRLGNRRGVLPHTVVLDGKGRVLESRVGMYSEPAMEERLFAATKPSS